MHVCPSFNMLGYFVGTVGEADEVLLCICCMMFSKVVEDITTRSTLVLKLLQVEVFHCLYPSHLSFLCLVRLSKILSSFSWVGLLLYILMRVWFSIVLISSTCGYTQFCRYKVVLLKVLLFSWFDGNSKGGWSVSKVQFFQLHL